MTRNVSASFYWLTLLLMSASAHMELVEASGIHPEHVLFGSWDKSPSRSIPETDPNALVSLIDYYFQHYK
jgi:hypothetical protein